MQLALSLGDEPFLAQLRDRLLPLYGRQCAPANEAADPLDVFVYAMIASQTRDEISWRAFKILGGYFVSWTHVMTTDPRTVERLIAPVTYATDKVHHLQIALSQIEARHGGLDLAFLADIGVDAGMHYLDQLDGAGPKIAAVTLNFSWLRKRALVVDMHLLRVGMRLGWLPAHADSGIGYDRYMRLAPDDWDGDALFELHWLIKRHSQQVCTYAAPRCGRCVLRDMCAAARPMVSVT